MTRCPCRWCCISDPVNKRVSLSSSCASSTNSGSARSSSSTKVSGQAERKSYPTPTKRKCWFGRQCPYGPRCVFYHPPASLIQPPLGRSKSALSASDTTRTDSPFTSSTPGLCPTSPGVCPSCDFDVQYQVPQVYGSQIDYFVSPIVPMPQVPAETQETYYD